MKPQWMKASTTVKKAAIACVMATLLTPSLLGIPLYAEDQAEKELDRMEEVYQYIQEHHVSAPDAAKLTDAAIAAMVKSLDDPYTSYMTADEWNKFMSSISRNYVGIGVRIAQNDNGVYVVQVFRGSPAEGGGVLPDDYIVAVNGESAEGKTTDQLVAEITGEKNTDVTVTFRRGTELIDVPMQRQQISIPVVEGTMFGSVGYLKLSSFSATADEQLIQLLDSWKSVGMTSLVLDLRDNGGGQLDTARNIASQFIPTGSVLIHTQDVEKKDNPVMIKQGASLGIPMYVLINEASASASEVLTGALQDYQVATVIGAKSFGKGCVQQGVQLKSGGMLKLTIEDYYTPNMNKVNKVGITPDIAVDGAMNQLLTALRLAGVQQFTLNKEHSLFSLNGFEIIDSVPLLQEEDNTYVHARVLADLIGAQFSWDEAAQAIVIQDEAGNTATFSEEMGNVKRRGNYLLVDLAAFSQSFPQLGWTVSGQEISLAVSN